MTFTVEDVAQAIETWSEEEDGDRFWDVIEYMGKPWGGTITPDMFPELGTLEFVEGYTGGEGGGEDAYVVFKLGDRYFRKQGYYASHYGTDWDGELREVNPVQRVVTFYE